MDKRSKNRPFQRIILCAAGSLFVVSAGAATSLTGAIDSSLAGGTLTADFTGADHAQAVAIQPNGRIVVAGYTTNNNGNTDFALVRYMADGKLDQTFGPTPNGKVTTHFAAGNAFAQALVIQPDGAIVVAGYVSTTNAGKDFAVARYTPDGAPDHCFNNPTPNGTTCATSTNGGTLTTDFGLQKDDIAHAVALQLDGAIVVAGTTDNGTDTDFAVARYTSDGVPDPNFGSSGLQHTDFGRGNNDEAYGVVVQPGDGKIVVSGYTTNTVPSPQPPNNHDFALARYNPDGTLDTNFGGGQVTSALGSQFDETYAVALQPDGKIVVAGRTENLTTHHKEFAVARYGVAGMPDSGFGNSGVATTSIGGTSIGGTSDDMARALAVQPDGKIVVAGVTVNNNHKSFALARYNPHGSLDTTFGGANGAARGTIVQDFGPTNATSATNEADALALQPDGKLVVAGYTNAASTGDDFAVARYFAADNAWGLAPSGTIGFADGYVAPPGSGGTTTQSGMLTVAGLGTATCTAGVNDCINVPVAVTGGKYAANGATAYTSGYGWAKNGEQFNVQQDIAANAQHGDTATTTLTMGGLAAANNYAVVLCPSQSNTACPRQYTFTSIVDNAPTISGTPATTIQVDTPYSFSPTASDPDPADSALTFSIQNPPTWASFDPATGTLSGTPGNVDIGTSGAIRISVTDSLGATAALPAFGITVTGTTPTTTGNGGGSSSGSLGPMALLLLVLSVLVRGSRRTPY